MLADGTRLPVRHPEWIFHPPGARSVILWEPDDRVKILDVALLLGVDVEPPVPAGSVAPDSNGGT